MTTRDTISRTMHDVGLAAWFGGSLMGAIGLNGAAADVSDPRERTKVASSGWQRWTPVNLAAIGAHLLGGAGLLFANKGRIAGQKGVGASTVAKTALTAAALGATAYSRALGEKVIRSNAPSAGGTTPTSQTPPDVADAQHKLNTMQWAIPALTGGLVWLTSLHGEQQKPTQQAKGMLQRVGSLPSTAGKKVKSYV
ncbi:MAG: hypothetical protein QOH99_153 [Frankiaceae bacterium]|jgi:hypothetical protein|nr:hypothetical protein [Frankiaceae bacterium]